MSWIIGGILGLLGFVGVLVLGWRQGIAFSESLWRAFGALGAGLVLGRLLFGPVGISLVKESAGMEPPMKAPAEEKKPETGAAEAKEQTGKS